MSGIYTAEKAYQAEFSTFNTRFDAVGFAPDGRLNYNVGFAAGEDFPATQPAGGPQGTDGCTAACDGVAQDASPGNICTFAETWVCGVAASTAAALAPSVANTAGTVPSSFVAQANGRINGTSDDTWEINENKILANTLNGAL